MDMARVWLNGYNAHRHRSAERIPRRRNRNGGPTMRVGDKVRLSTPENGRLHGSTATVLEMTDWGAHCAAPAAATGFFRALWEEMDVENVAYTGDPCDMCGSIRMRRAGACKVCEDCGSSSGCG